MKAKLQTFTESIVSNLRTSLGKGIDGDNNKMCMTVS